MIVLIRESRPDAISARLKQEAGGQGQQRLIEYGIGAQILLDLGVREMMLLSELAGAQDRRSRRLWTESGRPPGPGVSAMTRKGPRSVLIIEARFYEDIADELARGADRRARSPTTWPMSGLPFRARSRSRWR